MPRGTTREEGQRGCFDVSPIFTWRVFEAVEGFSGGARVTLRTLWGLLNVFRGLLRTLWGKDRAWICERYEKEERSMNSANPLAPYDWQGD